MKKKTKLSLNLTEVEILTRRWLCTLPANFGNLFSFELKGKLQRVCKFSLDSKTINYLIREKSEVSTVSILMGVSDDNQTFQPILELKFNNEKKSVYALFKLIKKPSNSQLVNREEINPNISELFTLHWQSLTNAELIDAFEGLVADKVDIVSGKETAKIAYSHQKLQRVRKYIYTNEETKAMLNDLAASNNPSFDLCLGSGLKVPNFHPFSFRPIINIKKTSKSKSQEGGSSGDSYDTSKPCPPICNG